MIRRFGEPIRKNTKYRPRPGAYAVLRRDWELLITFQSLPEPEFQLPGGGIDKGESPLQALHREVREETGWAMHVERRLGVFQRYCFMPDYDMWARKICHVYLCRPIREKWQIKEPHHSVLWVSISEAAKILGNEGDRHFVKALD